jgi:putative spermidine/putrescine transport system substrate-binding protein
MRRNPRKALVAAASALSMVALAACSSAPTPASSKAADSGEVNIIAYASVWQEQYDAAVLTPFRAKYPNIKINYVSKRSSAEMLSTLQGQKSKPATDVSIMDISVSESGNTQGLFDKIDPAKVPNLANVDKQFLNKDGYGPAIMVDAIGLVYDSSVVTTPPTSWNVLWDPQYKGKVNVVAPPSLLGLSLTAITATMEGEDYKQSIDKATAKLKALAPSIATFAPNPDEYQNVITGQTAMGLGQNGRGQYYSDQSKCKMKVAFPQEGTVYQTNTVNLVKGAPNSDAAQTFINYALSADAQSAFAAKLFYAPTVTNVTLPADVKKRIVATDGSLKIIPLDVAFLAANRDKWTDVWKREVIAAK